MNAIDGYVVAANIHIDFGSEIRPKSILNTIEILPNWIHGNWEKNKKFYVTSACLWRITALAAHFRGHLWRQPSATTLGL